MSWNCVQVIAERFHSHIKHKLAFGLTALDNVSKGIDNKCR